MENFHIKKKTIILGAGGNARVVVDCIDRQQYEIAGFLDKNAEQTGQIISGIPIIGDDSEPDKWRKLGIDCCIVGIGHIGNYKLRNVLYEKYRDAGFQMINAIHHTAVISPYAHFGAGNAIMPAAVINAGVSVADNCVINSGSVIEHDVRICSGVHIAPGCTVSGASIIGDNTFVGVGSTIIQGVRIGCNSIIGAGSVVVNDIPENVQAFGCPAKVVKEI